MTSDGRFVARVSRSDIMLDDHGWLLYAGQFTTDSGTQGIGRDIDSRFIRSLMEVFKVEYLSHINGKACWITRLNGSISLIEPLLGGEGIPFNVLEWADER